ncbi:DUF5392 family protein [Gracilibacillus marinus]|jgi:hypothetical protein|uniref:DUF5392 family protein n=1 Tax=Gracilibacillus marinus TaxID=630535 RepID=A0ABV8VXV6_9BACI
MFSFMTNEIPTFMRTELEKLFTKIGPLMKKNTKYMMFATPLILISVFNLVYFLFFEGLSNEIMTVTLIYALLAAIGFALYKESKRIKKQIKKLELEHIVKRIEKSDVMNEYKKKDYISLIMNQPRLGLQTFMNFLTEEEQRKQMSHFRSE